ncbi:hypothetical protein PCO31010_03618 [Pandoraea commovens]|uniref:Uncharacterized protein n=1 Tax=Pandoraea commovens TaxID=2508289 RepID=A0A5E4X0V1_9BURK|nr:hypothetical protein PCO31010_03618 [Pandoraea commovens]
MRLVCLLLLAYVLSLLSFAMIKVMAILLAVAIYGGAYQWSVEDTRFVVIRGSILALFFWVVIQLQYLKVRYRLQKRCRDGDECERIRNER